MANPTLYSVPLTTAQSNSELLGYSDELRLHASMSKPFEEFLVSTLAL